MSQKKAEVKKVAPAKDAKKEMQNEKGKLWIPENFLKKTRQESKHAEARKARRETAVKSAGEKRKSYVQKAEQYAKEYLANKTSLVASKRKARTEGSFYVPAESKVILVVRIRGINCLSPQVRKILQLLRLRQLHNATLVRVNKATVNMLRKVEPFIAYGYPNHETIRQLVYKRGYGKVNKQRIPITTNAIIEGVLGKVGINSVEDLIHELVTLGTNFKVANNFLWPFKLTSPNGGFKNKRHPFHKGGDWGNREEYINQLVRRMI
jgi:large subunit ribosomal protein L7e